MIQAIHFVMGRPRGDARLGRRGAGRLARSPRARGYLLGCHAFTLEETGEYARAERTERDGVDACAG
ncbi:MAG: hypothetical protein U5N55_08630 [Cypionkella sp.]|nr:hypothetical protein [Cypionkella sp.]